MKYILFYNYESNLMQLDQLLKVENYGYSYVLKSRGAISKDSIDYVIKLDSNIDVVLEDLGKLNVYINEDILTFNEKPNEETIQHLMTLGPIQLENA